MIAKHSSLLTKKRTGRLIQAAGLCLLLCAASAPAFAERTLPSRTAGETPPVRLFLPLVLRQLPLETLAFVSDRDGNWEIYVMGSDGSAQTRLTNNAADDSNPAWSPDGQQIAFTSARDGKNEIYVMNADGSNQTHLTDASSANSWPSWSPDGSHIVFQSTRDGNSELYVMNANGSGQTRLTNTAATEQAPEFSADGARIVYDVVTSEFFNTTQAEIYSMQANGSDQTRLTTDPAIDLYPRWSPDDTRIAFYSQRSPGGLYLMQANGSAVVPLLAGDEPDWSWNSARLAFFASQGIYVMDTNGNNAVRITDNLALNFWPRWRP